jgi:hypothetical protein
LESIRAALVEIPFARPLPVGEGVNGILPRSLILCSG